MLFYWDPRGRGFIRALVTPFFGGELNGERELT
jgi:hypothetical protein